MSCAPAPATPQTAGRTEKSPQSPSSTLPPAARNGWIDFVMLMDYTAMQKAFRGTVTRQKATDVGEAFLVPVMGPSCWPDDVAAKDACRILELGSILADVGFSDAGIYMFDTRAFGYLPLVMP